MAIIWEPADSVQAAAAEALRRNLQEVSPDWFAAMDSDGLRVFCTGMRSPSLGYVPLYSGAGVVLGTIFQRMPDSDLSPLPERATFGRTETAGILASEGRDLISSYWGRYLALITDLKCMKKWVVSDPIGGFPCFGATFRNVTILFSHIEDCLRLDLLRFSINWDFMATRVAVGAVQLEGTALNEVFKVRAGQCLQFSRGQLTRSFYWDPRSIACSEPVEDVQRAAALLRGTVRSCVHAWASCYESVVHRLSGGLDSSIVLTCLSDAPVKPRITCHNYYLPTAMGSDERVFAGLVTQRANCELVTEDRRRLDLRLEDLLEIPPSAVPAAHLTKIEIGPRERQLARERRAGALLAGYGGDGLFGRLIHKFVVTDYAFRHGIGPELFRLASRMGPSAKMSIWSLLTNAVRDGILRSSVDPKDAAFNPRDLVSKDVREAIIRKPTFLHPWFQPREGLPPGKLLHLRYALAWEPWVHDPVTPDDSPEEVYPLQSQPVVELVLRIPTYTHLSDGRDRGLARRAFASDLPAEIIARTWKGRPGNLGDVYLMKNIKFAREMLLDGLLVKERLLDRRNLERALAGPTRFAGGALEVFDHVITESWLRYWHNRWSGARADRSAGTRINTWP